MKATHVAKLFRSKHGGEASSIWLEGKRLTEAGFITGTAYTQVWWDNKITFFIGELPYDLDNPLRDVKRTVMKSGNNPAIRIEGKQVSETFAGHTAVKVSYEPGRITITNHNEDMPSTTLTSSTTPSVSSENLGGQA